MTNYQIIITKNNKHYKKDRSYTDKDWAKLRYHNLLQENKNVKFEKQYEKGKKVKYHIEFLSDKKGYGVIEWIKDSLGRNKIVKPRDGFYLYKKDIYKIPETFMIFGLPGRYDYDDINNMIPTYTETISMSIIQNILILDIEGNQPMFIVLKNRKDAKRLGDTLAAENHNNVLYFGRMDKTNRKSFYRRLEQMGIPLRMFYTKHTLH